MKIPYLFFIAIFVGASVDVFAGFNPRIDADEATSVLHEPEKLSEGENNANKKIPSLIDLPSDSADGVMESFPDQEEGGL